MAPWADATTCRVVLVKNPVQFEIKFHTASSLTANAEFSLPLDSWLVLRLKGAAVGDTLEWTGVKERGKDISQCTPFLLWDQDLQYLGQRGEKEGKKNPSILWCGCVIRGFLFFLCFLLNWLLLWSSDMTRCHQLAISAFV